MSDTLPNFTLFSSVGRRINQIFVLWPFILTRAISNSLVWTSLFLQVTLPSRLNTDLAQLVASDVKFASAMTWEISEEYILRSAQSFEGRHVLELQTRDETRSRVKAPAGGRQMMQATVSDRRDSAKMTLAGVTVGWANVLACGETERLGQAHLNLTVSPPLRYNKVPCVTTLTLTSLQYLRVNVIIQWVISTFNAIC